MHIKLIQNYSTDLQDILKLTSKENSFFISNWDKNEHILNIDSELVEQSLCRQEHINTYIMSKDMNDLKNQISLYLCDQGAQVSKEYMTVVSNGTSAAFISILQTFKQNVDNFLCIGPIYFTYMHLLKNFGKNLYHYNINLFDKIDFNLVTLTEEIRNNNIRCIILIQPFFGSGINVKESVLNELILFCEEQKIYLLIDYIYGNMDWTLSRIHNVQLIQSVTASQYCILYESVAKRIFLNGIKNAIIFSSPQFIRNINEDSEICLGSISYIQESLLHTIYSPSNIRTVDHFITNTISYASNNYKLLCTLVLGTDIRLCKSTCGYFTLMAIPKIYFKSSVDQDIVNELYQATNIVTIPHSRYYYNSTKYYCFRINLVSETSELLQAVEKILHVCSNSSNCDIRHIFC